MDSEAEHVDGPMNQFNKVPWPREAGRSISPHFYLSTHAIGNVPYLSNAPLLFFKNRMRLQ